jgi:hypothetical protein
MQKKKKRKSLTEKRSALQKGERKNPAAILVTQAINGGVGANLRGWSLPSCHGTSTGHLAVGAVAPVSSGVSPLMRHP